MAKTRTKRRSEKIGLSIYLYRILKSCDERASINRKAMKCANSLVMDLATLIANQAGELVEINKKSTMQAREIRSASKLLIRGQLGQEARTEASHALQRFKRAGAKKGR